MGRSWIRRRRRDVYYRRAKAEGYRSRAAYKLLEIEEKFRILPHGGTVVDLGAAPGGWSQVAQQRGGPESVTIAVDRVPLKPLEGVTFLQGDLEAETTLTALLRLVPPGADAVLSDVAPRLSGNRSLDHARSVSLAEAAYAVAARVLRPGGSFVVKVFQGEGYDAFRDTIAEDFASCRGFTPQASLSASAEIYVVARGWQRGPAT